MESLPTGVGAVVSEDVAAAHVETGDVAAAVAGGAESLRSQWAEEPLPALRTPQVALLRVRKAPTLS